MNLFQVTLITWLVVAVEPSDVADSPVRLPKQAFSETDDERGGVASDFGGFNGGGPQGKYFMDQYWAMLNPEEEEFGHVSEDPIEWEQRYEKLNHKTKRRQGQRNWCRRYQHLPKKDHYEFGYKRGNEHHHTERHEKAHPHIGQFKTKVKWGDTHGGHGEHYWDYNHHGHHSDGGGEEDEASQPEMHYEKPVTERSKREKLDKQIGRNLSNSLVFNTQDGTVTGEVTGQVYVLQPVAVDH